MRRFLLASKLRATDSRAINSHPSASPESRREMGEMRSAPSLAHLEPSRALTRARARLEGSAKVEFMAQSATIWRVPSLATSRNKVLVMNLWSVPSAYILPHIHSPVPYPSHFPIPSPPPSLPASVAGCPLPHPFPSNYYFGRARLGSVTALRNVCLRLARGPLRRILRLAWSTTEPTTPLSPPWSQGASHHW